MLNFNKGERQIGVDVGREIVGVRVGLGVLVVAGDGRMQPVRTRSPVIKVRISSFAVINASKSCRTVIVMHDPCPFYRQI